MRVSVCVFVCLCGYIEREIGFLNYMQSAPTLQRRNDQLTKCPHSITTELNWLIYQMGSYFLTILKIAILNKDHSFLRFFLLFISTVVLWGFLLLQYRHPSLLVLVRAFVILVLIGVVKY